MPREWHWPVPRMKRTVKARPTTRGWPGASGHAPRIQTVRSPFSSRMVVSVAVVTLVSWSKTIVSEVDIVVQPMKELGPVGVERVGVVRAGYRGGRSFTRNCAVVR